MAKIRCRLLLWLMFLIPVIAVACGGVPEAQTGDSVRVHYTGTLADGTVFDTSVGYEPLEFTLGEGSMIPGFEQAVIGMKVGEIKTVDIPADQAYGPYRDDLVMEMERSRFPEDEELKVDQQWQIRRADGGTVTIVITKVSETMVTVDANHRLAGKDLTFEIELVEIR